jgi:hypothetical protein
MSMENHRETPEKRPRRAMIHQRTISGQATPSASINALGKFKVQVDPEQSSNFHWIFTG